jgi:tetratricopeptide (TPR) repeat protein
MRRIGLAAILLLAVLACREENPDKFLKEGFISFQQQDYDGAIKNYEKAIALGTKSGNAYNMLGLAYRYKYQQTKDPQMGDSELIFFQKAVEVDPKNWAAMVNLGTSYYARGDKATAAVWFKRALAEHPNHPDKAQFEKMIAEGPPPPPAPAKKPQGR